MKTIKSKIYVFEFHIVLWSEDGNTLQEKYVKRVRRAKLNTAREYIKKAFPRPYFVELNTIKLGKY